MEKTYIKKIHIARNRLKAEYKYFQKNLIEQIKNQKLLRMKTNIIKNLKAYLKIIIQYVLCMKEIYIH